MINVQLGQHVAQRSEVELGARPLAGAHLILTLAILEKRSSGQLNTTSSKTPVSSAAR
jgi:hypothetical protein